MKRGTSRLKRTPFKRRHREGIRIMADGREIRSGKAYTALRLFTWTVQEGKCDECGRFMFLFQMDLDHPGKGVLGGRGLGGGTRDDRVVLGLCNIPRTENGVWFPRGCHSHIKENPHIGKTNAETPPSEVCNPRSDA